MPFSTPFVPLPPFFPSTITFHTKSTHEWSLPHSQSTNDDQSRRVKNLWALKIALNLMDTLATQCILFWFLFSVPSVSFCNLRSIFRKQTILHVRYVQNNVQMCDIGSNSRLMHPWKLDVLCLQEVNVVSENALCFFLNTSYVARNICCINTCCFLDIKCAQWKIKQCFFQVTYTEKLTAEHPFWVCRSLLNLFF